MHRTTAIRPMSPSTQLRFLLAWGQGRDSQDSQSPSSRRLHSKLSNNAQRDRSVSSSVRPGGRRKRSLTYVPMSAWVKDFKDEDDIDACSMRTAGTRRSPSAERYSVASRSASLVDRVTSVSSRQSVSMPQELTELSAPPRPPPRASRSAQRSPPPPLPPPRRAPHPPPRKALPPPPSRLLLPSPIPFETPPPTPPPPPARVASASVNASVAAVAITSQRRSHRHTLNVSPAELREALAHSASRSGTHQSTAFAAPPACVTIAENVRKRRVLRRPSDVAILLHDILAGRASRCGAGETSEVFAPAAGAASAKSTKPSHGSGAGRAIKSQDDLKKQQQKWYKKLAKSRSHSSESNIVDTLAEIIAEKITRADRLRQRQDSKGDSRPPKVAASSSNHSKDKANCAPGTERKVVKVKRHSKRSSTALDSSLSRQQNCSNCYEKPPRRNHGRRLCRSHALSMQSSTEGQNRNGDCWNNGSKSFRWSAESQELCHEWGLSNRSNAGNCRPSEELFLDRNFEPSQIRVTTTPVSVCGFSERLRAEQSRQRKVPGQYDNDTASGTCSTDEDTCSVRQLSTLAVYNQQLSGVNVASVSRSSDSSKLSLSEMDANSQIATTGAQIPPIQSLHERQIRHNADFESQTTAATASYTEDLFSGLLKGRDESDLLLPMVEAPRELKLNLVPAKSGNELGGGDCADMEARISILEPESMIRSSRCEGSSVLDATQASNQDASHSFRSDVSEKLHGQQNTLHWPKTRQAPCIGCEGFNGMVKTVNKKRTALRRRSRVHVVEPLSDAVQHKIELPSCIVEQNFSSWRPLIYAQLLKQNLTFTIVEIEVPEPESQPLSIFCNHCGSSNKVDNRVPAVHSSNLCSTESTLFRFCRCIVSRISETLEVSCCLLDSSIQLAGGKVNKSMLNATHAEAAVVRSSLCLHQRCGNRQKAVSTGVCQAWPPCRFYWTNCCRGASARRVRNSECLELLQIATNLAVQSQQQRNGSDVVVNEPATGFTDCGSSLPEFSRDLSPIEPLSALGCLKRLRSIEVSSIEKYKKVGSRYFNSHFLITHCPELITKPNLDFVSEVQEDSDDCPHGKHDQRTLQQQMPQQSWSSHKTATSENSSSESSVLTPGGRLPQPSDLYNNLYYKAAGDKLASPSHCQDKAVVPPHPHAGAADEGAGRSLPSLQSCSSRSFPSSSLCDVTPRFNEQIAAPVLSITCQLTVADQTSDANTSDSFEESLPAGDLA